MDVAQASTDRLEAKSAAKPGKGRSRRTNGRMHLRALGGLPLPEARRFADLVRQIAADFGLEPASLTVELDQLIRTAAQLTVEAEQMEWQRATGQRLDHDAYARCRQQLRLSFGEIRELVNGMKAADSITLSDLQRRDLDRARRR